MVLDSSCEFKLLKRYRLETGKAPYDPGVGYILVQGP